jgi:iron(III) transport system permease protein
VLLGLISIYPLGRFLLLPFFPSMGPTGGASFGGAATPLPLETIVNTLQVGIGAGLVVLPPGLLLVFLLERRSWAGNRAVALLIWLILLMPSYLVTSGWQILLASPYLQGSLLHRLFYSEGGLIVLLAIKGLPFACFSARASWGAIGNDIGDAARIHVAGAWRRMLIFLRLLMPACASIFAVVFIEAIQDFGIAATLGAHMHLPLVVYSIYTRLALTPVQFEAASALSWYLLLMAGAAVMLHFYIGAKMPVPLIHGRQRDARPAPCNWVEAVSGFAAIGVLGALGFGVPGLTLAVQSVSPVQHALKPEDWGSLENSALFSFLAATIAVLLAVALVTRARHGGGVFSRTTDLLTFGTMAIPGLLLGAA